MGRTRQTRFSLNAQLNEKVTETGVCDIPRIGSAGRWPAHGWSTAGQARLYVMRYGATITSAERALVAAAFLPLTWNRLALTPAATRASRSASARFWPTPAAAS